MRGKLQRSGRSSVLARDPFSSFLGVRGALPNSPWDQPKGEGGERAWPLGMATRWIPQSRESDSQDEREIQTLGRERDAHRWPSMVRGAMLALPTRSWGCWMTELWRVENLTLSMRGNSDAQKGAACSKVTLYDEGSNASSTNKESNLTGRQREA